MGTAIVIQNKSSVSDPDLATIVRALQKQQADVAMWWGISADLFLVSNVLVYPPSVPRVIVDSGFSTDPGALGFHLDDNGTPEAHAFPDEDTRDGAMFSVTLSHEIIEMLIDPFANRTAPVPNWGDAQALVEPCDPVEADEFGYDIDGVRVSDFVTPYYFGLPSPAPDTPRVYNFGTTKLSGPCPARLPGGYQEYLSQGSWHMLSQRRPEGKFSRRALRANSRRSARFAS